MKFYKTALVFSTEWESYILPDSYFFTIRGNGINNNFEISTLLSHVCAHPKSENGMIVSFELVKIFEQKFGRQEAERIVTLIDTYSTDRMQEVYMTKADKVELIDRINNLENKMLSKMEANFRWLVGVTITGIATTATIVKLIA